MNEISKEYGTALFMLACEENVKEEYGKGIETVEAVFRENPEYIDFLSSPAIPLSERLSAIEAAFSDNVPENVLSYIMLLCEKRRMDCFFESAEEYRKLLDASNHIADVKITSAVPLTDEEKQKLKVKLEAMCKNVVNMEYFIDESLLGGIVAEIDGKVLDGSLKTRLSDIKEVINK